MRKILILNFLCFVIANNIIGQVVQVQPPDHIVIVVFENHSFNKIISVNEPKGGRPHYKNFIDSIAHGPHAVIFTNSHGNFHPSQPNYLCLFSGSNQGVTDDTKPCLPFETPNLGNALISGGYTYASYCEGLPQTGSDIERDGNYARKHNPTPNWQKSKLYPIPEECNKPFSEFKLISDYDSLPTVSFVVPDLYNDMHGATKLKVVYGHFFPKRAIQHGANWLSTNLSDYQNWAVANNSLLIITFDESSNVGRKNKKNDIPTIFIGAMVKAGTDDEEITHYNVLKTILNFYGLPNNGMGHAANALPIVNCWIH